MLTKINKYIYDENNALIAACEILIEHKLVYAIIPTLKRDRYKVYFSLPEIEPLITDSAGLHALYAKSTDHRGYSNIDIEFIDTKEYEW